MWTNLLSGTLGSIIGVVGAVAVAVFTNQSARVREAEAARREHALRVSGDLAHRLVEFYDQLRQHAPDSADEAETVPTTTLGAPAEALRRAITVDAPLLDDQLERELRDVRKEVARVLPRGNLSCQIRDLRALTAAIRPAGDHLRELRRDQFERAPAGSRLLNIVPRSDR